MQKFKKLMNADRFEEIYVKFITLKWETPRSTLYGNKIRINLKKLVIMF